MRKIYGYSDMRKVVGIPSTNMMGYRSYYNSYYNNNRYYRRQQEKEDRKNAQKNSLKKPSINNNTKKYTSTDCQIIYIMEYAKTRNSKVYGQLNPNLTSNQTDIIDFQKRVSQISTPLRKPQIPERKSYTSRDSNIIYLQEYSRTRNTMLYNNLNTKNQATYNTSTTFNNRTSNIRSVTEYRQSKMITEYKKPVTPPVQPRKQELIRTSQTSIPLRKPQIPERKTYTTTDLSVWQEYSRTRNIALHNQLNAKYQATYNTSQAKNNKNSNSRNVPQYLPKREEVNAFKTSIKTQAYNIDDKREQLDRAILEFQKVLERKRRYEKETSKSPYRNNRRNTGFER